MRPAWDETFLDVAKVFARKGTCPRLSVGAVLVAGTNILAHGYNGARRKAAHCCDVGCDVQTLNGKPSCQRAVHAEANAVYNAAREGKSTVGSTLYVTHAPCQRCVDTLVQAGIVRVVYGLEYGSTTGARLLREAGVEVIGPVDVTAVCP